MTTPNETHLRTANRLISAFGIQAAPSLVASFIADDHPAAPALTGGDAELVAKLNLCASRSIGSYHPEIEQAAARITALSAQVAELSRASEYYLQGSRELLERCETLEDMHADAQESIAALERDKEEISEWRSLQIWGDSPQRVDDFIKSQQARIYQTQNIEAQLAVLERDAERLDWLEEFHLSLSRLTAPDMSGLRFVGQAYNPAKARGEAGGSYIRVKGSTIRAAIDSAMSGDK